MKERIIHWMHKLVYPPVVGIDISDQSVKYFQFGYRQRVFIDAHGEALIPTGVISAGEIKNEAELVRILKNIVKTEHGLQRAPVAAVSLPEEKSFLNIVELPKLQQEQIKDAIRWEIEANIPLSLEEIVYDYEVMESEVADDEKMRVAVVAFPKVIIASYISALKQSGIQLAYLMIEAQALAYSSLPLLDDAVPQVVIDFGKWRTSFIVILRTTIIFTRTVPIGGAQMEEAISKVLGVSADKADMIKRTIGLHRKLYDGLVFEAVSMIMSAFIDELRRTISYYRDHLQEPYGNGVEIGKILLSGGDANLFGLDTYLASALKIPVERIDPFLLVRPNAAFVIPPITRSQSLSYAVAIGLATRGLDRQIPIVK